MKTLKPFAYHTPDSIEEAVDLLNLYDTTAKIFAGGTDMMVMLKDRILSVDNIIDIKRIPGLNDITWDDNTGLRIGSLASITKVVDSDIVREKYPSLAKAGSVLGSPQVRNKATIGGNICRSSPSADTPPALIVFESQLTIAGKDGERTVPVEDFFTGPGRNVLDKEIVTAIILPAIDGPCGTAFGKISRVSEDLSKVNGAVMIRMDGKTCNKVRIVLGAVGIKPIRCRNVEAALEGKELNENVIDLASKHVTEDIKPIDDIRSTASYRYKVGQVLIKRLVNEAIENCGEK